MNVYEIVTDRILQKLEQGTIPWKQPWKNDGSVPMNLVSKKPYRGCNLFLLPREYPTNYFVSFKQALELGGVVKSGEHGSIAVFWKMFINMDAETQKEKTVPMLRYYTVFNVAQTIIPDNKIPHVERNAIDPIPECQKIVDNMPNRPTITHNEARAYYRPAVDTVNMPEIGLFAQADGYYSTIFHELGHSTGHASRLDRDGIARDQHGYGSKSYSREELVAEMTAAFLCGHCGIDTATIDNTAAYIASWKKALRDDSRCVVTAASQAQKSADYIMGVKHDAVNA